MNRKCQFKPNGEVRFLSFMKATSWSFYACGQWLTKKISEGRAKGAMPPPKFVENIVILCFERRFSKQNSVIRLKLNSLVCTGEYWQYTLPKTVYTFFIFRVWGEGHGTVATPFRTLVLVGDTCKIIVTSVLFITCDASECQKKRWKSERNTAVRSPFLFFVIRSHCMWWAIAKRKYCKLLEAKNSTKYCWHAELVAQLFWTVTFVIKQLPSTYLSVPVSRPRFQRFFSGCG